MVLKQRSLYAYISRRFRYESVKSSLFILLYSYSLRLRSLTDDDPVCPEFSSFPANFSKFFSPKNLKAKSVQPFSSYALTNKQHFIFIYKIDSIWRKHNLPKYK